MDQGQYIFSQIMNFLPKKKFDRCVDLYGGKYRMRSFSCFDQFLCMSFAQLTYRESLRDIECCLRAMQKKLYHIGIRGNVSCSTLAGANENRDWRIYCDFDQILIQEARRLCANDDFGLELKERVYALIARGYLDFKRLYQLHQNLAFFVTSRKVNTKFRPGYIPLKSIKQPGSNAIKQSC